MIHTRLSIFNSLKLLFRELTKHGDTNPKAFKHVLYAIILNDMIEWSQYISTNDAKRLNDLLIDYITCNKEFDLYRIQDNVNIYRNVNTPQDNTTWDIIKDIQIINNTTTEFEEFEEFNIESDYVDLGLPSGNLWDTCNIGADKPWEIGNYYAWGETETKSCYASDNYNRDVKITYGNHNDNNYGKFNRYVLYYNHDGASIKGDINRRMPLDVDFQELVNCTRQEDIQIEGVDCIKFISKKYPHRYIVLPKGGYKIGYSLEDQHVANYWCKNTITSGYKTNTQAFRFELEHAFTDEDYDRQVINSKTKYNGCPIRLLVGHKDLVQIDTIGDYVPHSPVKNDKIYLPINIDIIYTDFALYRSGQNILNMLISSGLPFIEPGSCIYEVPSSDNDYTYGKFINELGFEYRSGNLNFSIIYNDDGVGKGLECISNTVNYKLKDYTPTFTVELIPGFTDLQCIFNISNPYLLRISHVSAIIEGLKYERFDLNSNAKISNLIPDTLYLIWYSLYVEGISDPVCEIDTNFTTQKLYNNVHLNSSNITSVGFDLECTYESQSNLTCKFIIENNGTLIKTIPTIKDDNKFIATVIGLDANVLYTVKAKFYFNGLNSINPEYIEVKTKSAVPEININYTFIDDGICIHVGIIPDVNYPIISRGIKWKIGNIANVLPFDKIKNKFDINITRSYLLTCDVSESRLTDLIEVLGWCGYNYKGSKEAVSNVITTYLTWAPIILNIKHITDVYNANIKCNVNTHDLPIINMWIEYDTYNNFKDNGETNQSISLTDYLGQSGTNLNIDCTLSGLIDNSHYAYRLTVVTEKGETKSEKIQFSTKRLDVEFIDFDVSTSSNKIEANFKLNTHGLQIDALYLLADQNSERLIDEVSASISNEFGGALGLAGATSNGQITYNTSIYIPREGTWYACVYLYTFDGKGYHSEIKEINYLQFIINGHEYVDLGLPSGTLWATCNVGATQPEEYGNYYAWGETQPKSTYDWSFYKYGNYNSSSSPNYGMTKYNETDNKTTLDLVDDAARANWGGKWRMPTEEEQKELLDNCTWTWTNKNGVNGYVVKGKNGNTIFLPAAGSRSNSVLGNAGSLGDYWSSSLDSSSPEGAYYLDFFYGGRGYYYSCCNSNLGYRYHGLSVRAVITKT